MILPQFFHRLRHCSAVFLLLLGAISLGSCSNDDLSPTSVVPSPTPSAATAELDRWIRDSITLPYGIEVVYRQENHSGTANHYLVPPKVEQVLPVLRAFRSLCLTAFEGLEGQDRRNFLLGRAPLQLHLYGGAYRDVHGMERLSLPVPSTTMMISHCNEFDARDAAKVYRLARQGFHQLALRLQAQLPYDHAAFAAISGDRYAASTAALVAPWRFARTIEQQYGLDAWANKRGFLTIHSMVSPEADLAELISATLCATPVEIQAANARAATPDRDEDAAVQARYDAAAQAAAQQLAAKQAFVSDYLERSWHVNLKRWQLQVARKVRGYHNSHKTL